MTKLLRVLLLGSEHFSKGYRGGTVPSNSEKKGKKSRGFGSWPSAVLKHYQKEPELGLLHVGREFILRGTSTGNRRTDQNSSSVRVKGRLFY